MSKWISVEQELPPTSVMVLAWLYLPKNPPASGVTIASYTGCKQDEPENYGQFRMTVDCWWANGRYYEKGHITHWMWQPASPDSKPVPNPQQAETKGVEAMSASSICKCDHSAAMHEWHDDVSSCCLGKVHDTGSFGLRPRAYTCPGFRVTPPEPQRHARINCNGKSCGEYNCDTCHPQQEEALPYEWSEADRVRAREVMAARDRAGFAYDRDDFLHTLSFAQMRERQFRKSLHEIEKTKADRDHELEVFYDLLPEPKANLFDRIVALKDRSEAAEAELAALKATPKDDDGEVVWIYQCSKCRWIANPEHLGQPCSKCDGVCIRFATSLEGERRAVRDSNRINDLASQLKAAQSSPSLPLEEPEQLVSDADLAVKQKEWATSWTGTLLKELQQWRALAARRGGK